MTGMDPASEAAAFWGSAENNVYPIEQRLTMALKALEFYGAAYDAAEEPCEQTETADPDAGTPEHAVGMVRDVAEALDVVMAGYEPDDWRDAVRLLHALRRGIERLRTVDAHLVRWLYFHGEHGQHQTLDGVGPFSITRTRAKERWDVQGTARDYVEAKIGETGGEMPDPLQVVSWVLEVVSSSACRKTAVRAAHLDVEDYYSSEPGNPQVSLPR